MFIFRFNRILIIFAIMAISCLSYAQPYGNQYIYFSKANCIFSNGKIKCTSTAHKDTASSDLQNNPRSCGDLYVESSGKEGAGIHLRADGLFSYSTVVANPGEGLTVVKFCINPPSSPNDTKHVYISCMIEDKCVNILNMHTCSYKPVNCSDTVFLKGEHHNIELFY